MRVSLGQLLEDVAVDVRLAFRALRKSPGFAAAVIVTLGLGIGANAAMFGVVDRLMFRPYAYLRDAGTVHRVYLRSTYRETTTTSSYTEYARYLDLKRWTKSFDEWSAFATRTWAVGVAEASRERQVATVNASFFKFFDAKPALGRFFVPAEDSTPRGADVVVLGYGFWKAEFGGRNVPDEATTTLLSDVLAYPGVPEHWSRPAPDAPLVPVIPVIFAKEARTYTFFSAVTTLGTPQDVTLQELRIECFFPMDDETARNMRLLTDAGM